jgi:N-methylhydantoinase B
MAGGMAGGAGRVVVNPGSNHERILQPLSDGNMLKKGDVLRIETGGGGGYGHPYDRPSESVLDDVLGGFVTPKAARDLYGVAINSDEVDPDLTRRLRTKRPDVKAFHRHGYVDSLST